ncbi:MAG: hypothetical protein Q9160_009100 [Pyrenula sp. 1 TL-2023]
MSSSTKPTVLLVHGSWHTPKHYRRQLDVLEKNGFPTSCPLQPSVGKSPPIGLMEDAQTIREELEKLVDKECKDVIVVGHSYGGVVTAQAVDPQFARKARVAQGKAGGVIQLLFVCAFVLPLGESLGSTFGDPEKLPPFIHVKEDGMCMMLEPDKKFYQDLADDEQQHWVSELIECPAIAQLTRITQAAYQDHPSTYLFCETDQALPIQVQQMMVQKAEEAGVSFQKETCTASHSPFLSQPDAILNAVQKIAVSA